MSNFYVHLDINGEILFGSDEDISQSPGAQNVHSVVVIENFTEQGFISADKNTDGEIVGLTKADMQERLNNLQAADEE